MAVTPQLLSLREAAAALGVSGPTLERLIAAGALPTVKVSPRRRLIRCEDLEEYIASRVERREAVP
jgi:excisionase family DNA binding protein